MLVICMREAAEVYLANSSVGLLERETRFAVFGMLS